MPRAAITVCLVAACARAHTLGPPPAAEVAPARPGSASCERVAAHLVEVWRVDAARVEPIRRECEQDAYSEDRRRCLLAATRSSEAAACGHEPYDEVALGTVMSAPAAFAGKAVTVRAYVVSGEGEPVRLGQRPDAASSVPAVDAQTTPYRDVELVPLADLAQGTVFELRGRFDGKALHVESYQVVSPEPSAEP
jgi:hypothetical protein